MFDYGEFRNITKTNRRESLPKHPSIAARDRDIVYTRVSNEIIEVSNMKNKNLSKSPSKKAKKKRLIFKAEEENKETERAIQAHNERRAKYTGDQSESPCKNTINKSISPNKPKKKKRLIINGESPIKLKKI